jgi:hypothetical protein
VQFVGWLGVSEWKGGSLENLGRSRSCALLKTRSFGVRGSCRNEAVDAKWKPHEKERR